MPDELIYRVPSFRKMVDKINLTLMLSLLTPITTLRPSLSHMCIFLGLTNPSRSKERRKADINEDLWDELYPPSTSVSKTETHQCCGQGHQSLLGRCNEGIGSE